MDELVVLVNENNKRIGVMPRGSVHTAYTPLHRAFSVYVFNERNGKFLLTQRAKSKKVFPGIWTNTCCGHPIPGERTEKAIARRLEFELGLFPRKIKIVLPDFRYRAEMNGIVENEICPVYVATISTDPIRNPDEVEDFRWVDWNDFLKIIAETPGDFSPWCQEQIAELTSSVTISELPHV